VTDRPVLTTAKLVLRPAVEADADALHAIYADEVAMRWWSHGPLSAVEESRAKVRQALAATDWRMWAITLVGDDTAIGTLNAHAKRQGGVAEIGYSLTRAHWGNGLAREAVTALLDQLFAEGNRRVFADTDPDNAASNRLLETLGFTLEGRLRGEWETHIGVRDSLIWGLLREEWRLASAR
jgi:RimJ/RimL family protein N-acetyltransferase